MSSDHSPQPRLSPSICDAERTALTVALHHAGVIAGEHYTDTMPHYLVKPGMGAEFRCILYTHGCVCAESYHQDGHASGFADWRRIARV